MSKPAQKQNQSQFRKDVGSMQVDGNGSRKKSTMEIPKEEDEDDSMLDFRSPQRLRLRLEALKNPRKAADKPKKKQKKSNTETNQPRIECLFFRPQPSDARTMEICPLCLKPLKDENVKVNHMKSCATKNNVTTRQLMDAMELQERQAEERKAMGLISAPIVQPKKPSKSRIKKFVSDDPELQLALAISESLHAAQVIEQIEEAEILATSSSQPLIITSEEERRKTLQNFGFTSNKPVVETANTKSKKKKLQGPTILQTRSSEEKERLLTEKIAEILTGDEAFTQALGKQSQKIASQRQRISLLSSSLREIEKREKKIWDRSSLTSIKVDSFYVEEISEYISPGDKNHAGYIETYDSNELPSEKKVARENCPVEANPETMKTEIPRKMTKSVNSLISNWADTLNDSSFSDMLVFASNRQIWVHKLVFLVRCPNVLESVTKCEDDRFPRIRENIVWRDTERSAALAFLEFVYCGVIRQRESVLMDALLLKQVQSLARKYKMKELFDYLRQDEESTKEGNGRTSKVGNNVENVETEVEAPEESVGDEIPSSSPLFDTSERIDEKESSIDENEGNLDILLSLAEKDSQALSQSDVEKKIEEVGEMENESRGKRLGDDLEENRGDIETVGKMHSQWRADNEEVQKLLDTSLENWNVSLDGTPMRSGMRNRNPFSKKSKGSIFSKSLFSPEEEKKGALTAFEESLLRHRDDDRPGTWKEPERIHNNVKKYTHIVSSTPCSSKHNLENDAIANDDVFDEDIVNCSLSEPKNSRENEEPRPSTSRQNSTPENSRGVTKQNGTAKNVAEEESGIARKDSSKHCWPEDDDFFQNDAETDDSGKSRYSIYRKSKKDNSIFKYKEAWKNLRDAEVEVIVLSDEENEQVVTQREEVKEKEKVVEKSLLEHSRKRSFTPEGGLNFEQVSEKLPKKKRKLSESSDSESVDVTTVEISSTPTDGFSDLDDSNRDLLRKSSQDKTPDGDFHMDMDTPEFIRKDREAVKKNQEENCRGKRGSSLSPKRDDVRKFRVKAKSDMSFQSRSKAFPVLNPSPENFEDLEATELESKLAEYGLKPQKREQAILLLNTVQKTLQIRKNPITSPKDFASTVSSDDEEPDFTKTKEKTINKGPTNINDAFKQLLLNNRDLHNKILKYEPIELNIFLSMLKQEGFKCKKNELMDYLDEKCITFTTDRRKEKT